MRKTQRARREQLFKLVKSSLLETLSKNVNTGKSTYMAPKSVCACVFTQPVYSSAPVAALKVKDALSLSDVCPQLPTSHLCRLSFSLSPSRRLWWKTGIIDGETASVGGEKDNMDTVYVKARMYEGENNAWGSEKVSVVGWFPYHFSIINGLIHKFCG